MKKSSLNNETIDRVFKYIQRNKYPYLKTMLDEKMYFVKDIKQEKEKKEKENFRSIEHKRKLNDKLQSEWDLYDTIIGPAGLKDLRKKTDEILNKDGTFSSAKSFHYRNKQGDLTSSLSKFECTGIDSYPSCHQKTRKMKKILQDRVQGITDTELSDTYLGTSRKDINILNKNGKALSREIYRYHRNLNHLDKESYLMYKQRKGCVYKKIKELQVDAKKVNDEKYLMQIATKAYNSCNPLNNKRKKRRKFG